MKKLSASSERKYISIEGRRLVLPLAFLAERLEHDLFYRKCTLKEATHLAVTNQYGQKSLTSIKLVKCASERLKRFVHKGFIRMVEIQYSRYIYDVISEKYIQPVCDGDLHTLSLSQAFARSKSDNAADLKILYGKNELSIKRKSLIRIVFGNVTEVLFLANIVAIINYYRMGYTMYFVLLIFISLYQLGNDVYSDVVSQRGLAGMMKKVKTVKVFSNGKWQETSSSNLYPGNIMLIDRFQDFPCDCKILKGDVIVDESFLTGESIPVNKSFDGNNMIFAGTSILRSRGDEADINEINSMGVSDKIVKVKNLVRTKNRASGELATQNLSEAGNNACNAEASGINTVEIFEPESFSYVPRPPADANELDELVEDVKCDHKNVIDKGCTVAGCNEAWGISSAREHEKLKEVVSDTHPSQDTHFAIGLVTSTGFETTKGKLLKSILTPRPPIFQFYTEAKRIIAVLAAIGTPLCFFLFVYFATVSIPWKRNREYVQDIFFVLISPSLLTAVIFGASISQKRLRSLDILCYDKERINSAGQVDLVVFDKTGTLTEEGLDVYVLDDLLMTYSDISACGELLRLGISVCHGVMELDGEVSGDPLDIKLFKFAMARINSNKEVSVFPSEDKPPVKAQILRVFEFNNKLRRMSTLVECNASRFIFTKGSPESLKPLLGTVPVNYDEEVKEYALDGYRVIALAYRKLGDAEGTDRGRSPEEQWPRAGLETHLKFLALIVFENKLKRVSKSVVSEINDAGIKTIMATGDNILTAVCVGREVGMIDETCPVIFPVLNDDATNIFDAEWMCIGDEELVFDKIKLTLYKGEDRISYSEFVIAIEGREYEFFKEEKTYFDFILAKAVVFSRMSSEQKKMLVEDLAEKGYITAFCGDGANDCGALKSSEVGIALTQNEASVASSFTSKVRDVSAVTHVLREGRAALVGSVCRFKFMLMTVIIQFTSLFTLSLLRQFLSDLQTIHFDILSVLLLASLISGFRASPSLINRDVASTLLEKKCLVSLAGYSIIQLVFSLAPLLFFDRPLYSDGKDFNQGSELDTAVFFVTCFQMYTLALLLTEGKPHRESKGKNKSFLYIWSLLTLYTIILLTSVCWYEWRTRWWVWLMRKYKFSVFGEKSKCVKLVVIISTNLVFNLLFTYFSNKLRSRCVKDEQADEIWDEIEY